jgi:hypothetical protein
MGCFFPVFAIFDCGTTADALALQQTETIPPDIVERQRIGFQLVQRLGQRQRVSVVK